MPVLPPGWSCCVLCRRLEGPQAAQRFAVQLIKMALKRGQFYLCAEILRFLIPPREGVVQWGPCSPPGSSAGASKEAAAAAATGAKSGPPRQPSGSAEAGQAGWFSWLWGSSGASQPQQQQPADKAGKGLAGSGAGAVDAIAAGYPGEGGLLNQSSLPASASLEHGSDACKIVADKAWRLLFQVGLTRVSAGAGHQPVLYLEGREAQQYTVWGAGRGLRGLVAQAVRAPGSVLSRAGICRPRLLAAIPDHTRHPCVAARHRCRPAAASWSQGKLGQLVQLIHSMSFLTGGLASIMAAFRPQQDAASLAHAPSSAAEMAAAAAGGGLLASKQQQQQQWAGAGEAGALSAAAAAVGEEEGEVTVDVLIECVLAAVEELPVWESTDVEQVRPGWAGASVLTIHCEGCGGQQTHCAGPSAREVFRALVCIAAKSGQRPWSALFMLCC